MLTSHLFIGSIELRTLWEEKSLYIMNTVISSTFDYVERNAAITQGLSAFQTGGPHNTSTVVTQMARPWAGSGSPLLNTRSVEHHDGAAISLTARDGVPNYHNDNSFTSTPFGRGNDKTFFLLFCERRPLIGRCQARSRNMLRPFTKGYHHQRQPHNYPSMPILRKRKACTTLAMPLLKRPCSCKVPDMHYAQMSELENVAHRQTNRQR